MLGYLKISDKDYLDYFFDSLYKNKTCSITRGKVYKIIKKVGYGNYEDITIMDDSNKELTLPDFFFEEPDLNDIQNMNKVKVLEK